MKSTFSCITLAALVGAFAISACGERDAKSPTKAEVPVEQTPEQQFAAALKAAEQGNIDAQFNLARMYSDGEGVAKDSTKAFEWYSKAAELGLSKAQFNLGWMYFRGDGVTEDAAKAAEWWRKAAEQGHADAQVNLGLMHTSGGGVAIDPAKAADWYRKAAEGGNATGQFFLGVMYMSGQGVAKDSLKAAEWWRKAAEQGHASAQYNLGYMYAYGTGVAKDIAKAAEWYRKSAEQGNTDAQYSLGFMYSIGQGLARDDVLAYAWINLAAANGDKAIVASRDELERYMSKQHLQEAQQLSTQWKKGESIVRAGSSHSNSSAQSTDTTTLQKRGAGTIFVVSEAGHAVTNHHVVQGCKELRLEGRDGVAKLVTEDKVNDLALLQIPGQIAATAPIAKDPQKVRQGEEIVVFGFPLNFVLSSGGNLTPGVISALTGLGNNTNHLQITAPIQPGSSGSPVLNKKGEVVGAVVMKLSDKEMAKATGSIGQNVSFAVSGQTLKTFLDTHKVDYRTTGMMSFDKSTADIADEARKWTAVVECWK